MASCSLAPIQLRQERRTRFNSGYQASATAGQIALARQFCRENDNGTSQYFSLSQALCPTCKGEGTKGRVRLEPTPCECVKRKAFRCCLEKYRGCQILPDTNMSVIGVNDGMNSRGQSRRVVFGFRNTEFVADFDLAARRTLDKREQLVLRLYHMEGLQWRLCAKRAGVKEPEFFRYLGRVEAKLGGAFMQLKPYPLYPLHVYFSDGAA